MPGFTLNDVAEAVQTKIPNGWRIGSHPERPLSITKRNLPGQGPKWQDIGGVTPGEIDVIVRTSTSVQHAAKRVIDKVMEGIPVEHSAVTNAATIQQVRDIVNQAIEEAFARRQQQDQPTKSLSPSQVQAAEPPAQGAPESPPPADESATIPPAAVAEMKRPKEVPLHEQRLPDAPLGEEHVKRGPGRKKMWRNQIEAELAIWTARAVLMKIDAPQPDQFGSVTNQDLNRLGEAWASHLRNQPAT